MGHIARALTTPKLAQPTMLKYLLIALSLTAVLADLEDLDDNLPMELIDGQTSSFLDEIGNDMDVKVEDVAQAEMNMNDMDVMVEESLEVLRARACATRTSAMRPSRTTFV